MIEWLYYTEANHFVFEGSVHNFVLIRQCIYFCEWIIFSDLQTDQLIQGYQSQHKYHFYANEMNLRAFLHAFYMKSWYLSIKRNCDIF